MKFQETAEGVERTVSPQDTMTSHRNWQVLINLALLYASKSGAIVVGMFILPWYQRLLGVEAFGVVAMVFSLQAFLVMLDLGTSTLVGRDVATNQNNQAHLITWRAASLILHMVYFGLLIVGVFANAALSMPISPLLIVLCIVFFWSLTVNNVGQSALLAKRRYAISGSIQVVGVLSRAMISLAALTFIGPNLTTFFATQALTAVVQMMVTSWFCRRAMGPANRPADFNALRARMLELARHGRSLVLFGLAGAAVLQLDKVIIPLFISPAALSPYFLASALCLTPISVLAGPINQYYFPRVVESISNGDAAQTGELLRTLTLALVAAVSIPSALLWLGRDPIINMWLHHQPIASEVIRYFEILLPGVALGALGYVPYNILIAHQDYRMHAILSAAMTIITLLAAAISAAGGSIFGVCWVYAGYHSLSAVVIWLRATRLEPSPPHNYATRSASYAFALFVGIATIMMVLSLFISILFQ